MPCTGFTKPYIDFLQCRIHHHLLWKFTCRFQLFIVSKRINSCHNWISVCCTVSCEIEGTQGPLGYISTLSTMHFFILVASPCLRSHNAQHTTILKSLNIQIPSQTAEIKFKMFTYQNSISKWPWVNISWGNDPIWKWPEIWVNISSGNAFMPDCTKPLPELILT